MPARRPQADECSPFYHSYIEQVKGEDILASLSSQKRKSRALMESWPLEMWDFRYAPDKWTVKELMLHVIDAERVFIYRALRIARNDQTPMPGFDQDDYIPFSGAEKRTPQSIIEEYDAVREASLQLFLHFSPEMWGRVGTASGNQATPRALAYIIAGHELHHLNILKERYFQS